MHTTTIRRLAVACIAAAAAFTLMLSLVSEAGARYRIPDRGPIAAKPAPKAPGVAQKIHVHATPTDGDPDKVDNCASYARVVESFANDGAAAEEAGDIDGAIVNADCADAIMADGRQDGCSFSSSVD